MSEEFVFAEKSNFEDIISLWQQCFDDDREYTEDYLSRFYNEKRILLCKVCGKIVAMASLFNVDIDDENGIYIFALGVDKEFRGLGIASRLLDYVQNLYNSVLILQPEHNGVERFYKKIGFEILGAYKLDDIIKKYGIEELTLGHYDGFMRKRI